MPSPHDSGLTVALDAPLPLELKVGRGTALFVAGTCFHRDGAIQSLELVVDGGVPQPVAYHGMPRLDLFRTLHPQLDAFATDGVGHDPLSTADPWLHGYRSGFWGVAEIGPGPAGPHRLELRATLQDGAVAVHPLATLTVPAAPEPAPLSDAVSAAPGTEPLVAVAMATYQPPPELFARQIESIRAQTHRNWVCVISDDGSSPERLAAMRDVLGDDPRFVLSPSPRRLGFYLNFERALELVPREAAYVALADQDDDWFKDKLEVLLARIGDGQLVYSDARLVDESGRVLSDTYWVSRGQNHDSLGALLMTNSVTGAASLVRRDLLDDALPFPPAQFTHFHDHWLALVALARGRIEFVDRPLYDYVQHGGATLGHAAANQMPGLITRLRRLSPLRDRVVLWRQHYFIDVCRLTTWATILRMRCGAAMSADKRRSLERFVGIDRSLPALAGLWWRGGREILRRSSRTLGAEWMLAYAFTWRRLLSARATDRPLSRLRLDALPPPELVATPGRRAGDSQEVRAIADKIAPLPLLVSDAAPPRLNLLIPSIDLQHLFGGYIGKFNLARRLAENGQRVRIVTVDPNGQLASDYRQRVERYSGLDGLFDDVELALGREMGALEISAQDRFIATTWWTAHIAHAAAQRLGTRRFAYLIQEYEPFTFAMGSYAALAAESYELPHHGLFSTELLRDYFRAHGIGVFAGNSRGAQSASFQNAIVKVPPPTADALRRRADRRLLLYARPEAHASRNMFELAVLALERALDHGAFAGWELRGIGSIGGGRRLPLTAGATLELLPRRDETSYTSLLGDHDVGLALMYTPHPSLVPLEMASAGMLTVTNTFENKTAEAMSAISPNLIAAPPTIAGVAGALQAASDGVERYEERARGSAVSWSRDWRESLPDELIARVIGWLRDS